jgi:hypothetical protein
VQQYKNYRGRREQRAKKEGDPPSEETESGIDKQAESTSSNTPSKMGKSGAPRAGPEQVRQNVPSPGEEEKTM